MKIKTLPSLIFFLFVIVAPAFSQDLGGKLKAGTYTVGFKTIRERDQLRNGRPLVISIWYPAKSKTKPVSFKDYLVSGIINSSFTGPTESEKANYIKDFRETFSNPRMFGLQDSMQKFEAMLDGPMRAYSNAPAMEGKFPTVIMSSEPESLAVTAEWLASYGFVVVAVQAHYGGPMPEESMLWDLPTRDMLWMTDYTKKIDMVDQDKIAAFGFGGGIIPAFFLTMKKDHIKALVNLEGAAFQPMSLITKSPDYQPGKMKTPMLHIVTANTRKNESEEEVRAIQTTLYRLLVANDRIQHHDFSIFGRVIFWGLGLRANSLDETETVYVAAHELLLSFLNERLRNKGRFDPAAFNSILRKEQ
jgi:hypothetical protein